MSTTDLDRLIREEIEHSEHNRNAPLDTAALVRPNREPARVYSVRLGQDTVDELETLSKELDAPTSAIIRGFIADGMAARRERSVADVVDRLDAEVRMLRSLVGGHRSVTDRKRA